VEVPFVDYQTLSATETGESSEAIRERVERTRAVQREPFAGASIRHNSANLDSVAL
jgi:magnesium chelatase family protein